MSNTFPHYTSAGNFISSIQGSVDPRTGLFSVQLPLMNIQSNALMGPSLSLKLSYSPLSSVDKGFGKGFRLNLSQYDKNTGQLLLSTGEEYRIGSNGQVKQQKLKNFKFNKLNNTTYYIIYKSGLKEYLIKHSGDIYVVSQISSADGRTLHLAWDSNFFPARLTQITDDYNHILCSVTYPDKQWTTTRFTVLPNNIKMSYNITFKFQNEMLIRMASDAVNPKLVWSFYYDDIGPQERYRAITEINSPTGLIERVSYYSDEGMDFPEIAKLPPLPCVYQHTLIPGGEQPKIITKWYYTQKNYLGKDAGLNLWQPDEDQMLNILLKDYQYGSTEKRIDVNGSVLCTITRRYNSYHLLESQMTLRNKKINFKETEYYAKYGVEFSDQPAQYALPKIQRERWSEHNKNGTISTRTIQTLYEFDEASNPIRQKSPDGTVTEYTYYPSIGEESKCPPDPHGFIRYQRMQTVTPPQKSGNEFCKKTIYIWQKLDALDGNGYAVVEKANDQCIGNKRKLTQNSYYTDRRAPLFYGRINYQQITNTPDIHQIDTFTTTNRFNYRISSNEITEESKFIGHDGLISTETTVHDLWTGKLLSETTSQGVETSYSYDKIGRLTCRTLCPNSEYENVKTWDYGISKDGFYAIENDVSGNKSKTLFDCAGRKISGHDFDAETATWHETFCNKYNSLGELNTGTVNDWVTGTSNRFPLNASITYDGWGEKKMITFSSGKTEHKHVDYIQLIHTTFTEGCIDEQHTVSGSVINEFDKIGGQLIRKTLKNISGEVYSSCLYTWDGLGQLLEEQDELGQKTKRTYDEYGRVLSQTLPDGTVMSQQYAPHLTGKQIASIMVTGTDAIGETRTWLLGTQKFDSLGRLIERVSGGRSTSYAYEGSSSKPSTVTLSSGKTLNYTYVPELDYAISSMTTDGITQMYVYDKNTRKLLTAQESSSKIQYTWSKNGQLMREIFSNNGTTKVTEHIQTSNNVPVNYTDVSGKTTQYTMNSHGQVIRIVDHNITVDLTYDALARLSTKAIRDKSSSSSLTTKLNYDDFGREITRTIIDDRGMKLVVWQTWKKNGLLATRTIRKNAIVIRKEQFVYDNRNRLISYETSGVNLPIDPFGHEMIGQTYQFDALNNLITVKTTLAGGTMNTATYHYESINDPTQLTSVTNTHEGYPAKITLIYDTEGRMICDEGGKTLVYDAIGRLASVSKNNICKCTYRYDALNRLITQTTGENDIQQLYYRGTELVNEVLTPQQIELRFIKSGRNCLAISDNNQLTLSATDKNDSLLWSTNANNTEFQVWSPYGIGTSKNNRLPGFNGERIDPLSGMYHLGNGYRAYNPVLMRFNCPDSLSPFSEGGINPYAYCSGDPINHTDPSGHLSWQAITGIVLGAIGIGLAIITAGTSIAAAGGVMAAISSESVPSFICETLGVISEVTGVTSDALEDVAPAASNVLGWMSILLGYRISKYAKAAEFRRKIPHIQEGFIHRNTETSIARHLFSFSRKTFKQYSNRKNLKRILKTRNYAEVLARFHLTFSRISPVIDGVFRFIPSNNTDAVVSKGRLGVDSVRYSFGAIGYNADYHSKSHMKYEELSEVKNMDLHFSNNYDILDFCYERNNEVLRNILISR